MYGSKSIKKGDPLSLYIPNVFVAEQLLSITRDYNELAGESNGSAARFGRDFRSLLNSILTNIFHEILLSTAPFSFTV